MDHARLDGIQNLPCSDQAEIHFVRPRAVADFERGVFGEFEADAFFDLAFAEADHAINTAFLRLDSGGEFAQAGHHKIRKHRLQLARRAGHQEKMRRGPGGLGHGGNVKSGRGAVRIFQNLGAFGNHRLAEHALDELVATRGESGLDVGADCRIGLEFSPEQLGDDLARDVIGGGAESAGDEKHLCAAAGFENPIADGGAVGDGCLSRESETEREDLAGDPAGVGVLHAAEKQLRADIQDLDGHFVMTPQAKASIQLFTRPWRSESPSRS